MKKDYPDWGAPKIREKVRGRCGPLRCPAISAVHSVLDRYGLVQRRVVDGAARSGRRCRRPARPMRSGVRISKANFASGAGSTATA
jgi:putative transposase